MEMKSNDLKKIKVDIDYLDPITFIKVCSYNQCFHKFVPATKLDTYVGHYRNIPVTSTIHFHECSDCKRTHSSKEDKNKSWENRRRDNAESMGFIEEEFKSD